MQNEFDMLNIGGTPVYAADVEARADIAELQELYQSLTQSDIIPCAALPAQGVANKIYRVAGTGSYSDYMYAADALTTPILLATYNNAIDTTFGLLYLLIFVTFCPCDYRQRHRTKR